mmetsp:Transcript_31414/g.91353  ORF Transcript_31414/g.91353 Transcript_31414/m.91353 type:complete len:332 (-) Transcript_31414:443-1438(-)
MCAEPLPLLAPATPGRGIAVAGSSDVQGKAPPQRKVSSLFGHGMLVGMLTTGMLSPVDRALYLSVLHRRPFLSLVNFKDPYQGVLQALFGKVVSNGLYFPIEEIASDYAQSSAMRLPPNLAHTLGGMAAGISSALILNPVTVTRHRCWSIDPPPPFFTQAMTMWRLDGPRPFLRGARATIVRDLAFGGVFSGLRFALRPASHKNSGGGGGTQSAKAKEKSGDLLTFAVNVLSAALATVVSSPFNFVRNSQFAVNPAHKAPSISEVLSKLWREAMVHEHPLTYIRMRLNFGWGALRVGIGMALGSQLYTFCGRLEQSSWQWQRRKETGEGRG